MSYAELFPVANVPSEKSVFGTNVPCFFEVSILYSVEAPPYIPQIDDKPISKVLSLGAANTHDQATDLVFSTEQLVSSK